MGTRQTGPVDVRCASSCTIQPFVTVCWSYEAGHALSTAANTCAERRTPCTCCCTCCIVLTAVFIQLQLFSCLMHTQLYHLCQLHYAVPLKEPTLRLYYNLVGHHEQDSWCCAHELAALCNPAHHVWLCASTPTGHICQASSSPCSTLWSQQAAIKREHIRYHCHRSRQHNSRCWQCNG